MERIRNKLITREASSFFDEKGIVGDNYANRVLISTIRYLAVKNCNGELNKCKCVKMKIAQGVPYSIEDGANGYELIIYNTRSLDGVSLLNDQKDWVELTSPPFPIAQFLSQTSRTKVCVNFTKKKAIVLVECVSEKWIVAFCSTIFRILTWRFSDTLSDEEKTFFGAINKKNYEKFNEIIDSSCEGLDFVDFYMRENLNGWANGYTEARIKALNNSLSEKYADYQSYQAIIANTLDEIRNKTIELQGLQTQVNKDEDDVYVFFKNHKQIHLLDVTKSHSGNTLLYVVTETIEYFDEDEFMRSYNNPRSPIGENNIHSDLRKILFNLFSKHKGVIKTASVLQLNNLSSIKPIKGMLWEGFERNHLPHPHILGFGCLGQNEQLIDNAILEGNWDVAIEQTIAATKNINFGDSTVMIHFANVLTAAFGNYGFRIITADNGVDMSLREFLNYIEQQEKEEIKND